MTAKEHRPSILMIDDMPVNLQVLSAALASDFKIQLATSGAVGLALAAQRPPDLVLIDVMMPGIDGFEVCRRFKANPVLQAIPVIFLTASKNRQIEAKCLQLGASDYFTKPIEVEIVTLRIRNLLERELLRKKVQAQHDHLQQLVAKLKAATVDLEQTVARRTAELRSVALELLVSETQERRAIAGELHDDLGQNLAIVKLKLSAMELPAANQGGDWQRCHQQLQEVEAIIDRSSRSLRSLSTQLSPPVLSQSGLGSALEWLSDEVERNYGLIVHLNLGEIAPLDETTGNTLFRIVRELLINISKHARVGEANVLMSTHADSGSLVITVTDDGVGFDVAQAQKPSRKNSYGLFSIQQRISFIGGTLEIDSQPGSGTAVTLTLPVIT